MTVVFDARAWGGALALVALSGCAEGFSNPEPGQSLGVLPGVTAGTGAPAPANGVPLSPGGPGGGAEAATGTPTAIGMGMTGMDMPPPAPAASAAPPAGAGPAVAAGAEPGAPAAEPAMTPAAMTPAAMTDVNAATDGPAAAGDCPSYVGEVIGMAVELPGCCMPEGVCGVVSSVSNDCITSSPLLADLRPGDPC